MIEVGMLAEAREVRLRPKERKAVMRDSGRG
jgi:hypothetical protein